MLTLLTMVPTNLQIFCAECNSREAFPDNDIILCDGTCNRAFHQKCLDPPLETESSKYALCYCSYIYIYIFVFRVVYTLLSFFLYLISTVPPGDQGWFCKFCDCKIEIIDAMNAQIGTQFSVDSNWQVNLLASSRDTSLDEL